MKRVIKTEQKNFTFIFYPLDFLLFTKSSIKDLSKR